MAVTLSPGRVHGWDGWWIRRPPLELGLVPSIGGRVMSMRWRGHELSFVDPGHAGRMPALDGPDPRAVRRTLGFVHWGGDKTWLSPQESWPEEMPHLDVDAGVYAWHVERVEPSEVRVAMTSPVCREVGVRVTRRIVVPDAGDVVVEHGLENAGSAPVTHGLWDVHELRGPGIVYVPRRPGSPFRDGVKAFPAEGDSETSRAAVVRIMDGIAAIDCRAPRWFKFGLDTDEGWALGVLATPGGLVGYRKSVAVEPGATYGHGCVVEVYNAPRTPYFEQEVHGPVMTLAPGARTTLVERRRVVDVAAWPASERDVRACVADR